MMWQEWWIWICFGIGLAILEILVPGYIFLGFAIGAAITGALMLFGLSGLSFQATLVVFAALSLGAYLALRQFLKGSHSNAKIIDRDINDNS